MLLQLYPRVHRRYSSLSVFGPIVENFGAWLVKQGYSTDCVREHFCCMRRIARLLRKRGVGTVDQLTKAILNACAPVDRLDDRRLAASVRKRLVNHRRSGGEVVVATASQLKPEPMPGRSLVSSCGEAVRSAG